MPKYTEEQMMDVRDAAYTPKADVLDAFSKLVESVKEHLANERKSKAIVGDSYIDEHGHERSYSNFNRRRLSRGGNNVPKPNLRKKAEITVDEEGWETYVKPRKSFVGEDHENERQSFREGAKDSAPVRVRPNNKNLGSSKAVDPRDAIADKHTNTFNAFEALGDDDE